MTQALATPSKTPRALRLAALAVAAAMVAGITFAPAVPAEAATKVMSGYSKNYLTCQAAYDSASRYLVKAGYDSQVHNKWCQKRWTWSKGFIYEWKITAKN